VDASLGSKVAIDSRVVLQRLAQRTLRFDFSVWFWGDAIAFDGLLDAAQLLSDRTYSQFCERYFEGWQERSPSWTDYPHPPGLSVMRTPVPRSQYHYMHRETRGIEALNDESSLPATPRTRTEILALGQLTISMT
jgi:hypothetical protein